MQQTLFDRYGSGVDAGQDHHARVPKKADGNCHQGHHQQSYFHRSVKKPPRLPGGLSSMFEPMKAQLRL